MKTYLNGVREVLENGRPRDNRTDTKTIGVFGQTHRYSMIDGFPLVTTKKVNPEAVFKETKFFIDGKVNALQLAEQGVKIWLQWATEDGDLGPIYGKQWREWKTSDGKAIDQLEKAIQDLQHNQWSRRIIISAWNPEDLPDESKSPQENVKDGKMALAPCHMTMQFHQETMHDHERWTDYMVSTFKVSNTVQGMKTAEQLFKLDKEACMRELDEVGYPTQRLNLALTQRSQDKAVGEPYNIAGYSFILHMFAHSLGYAAGDFLHFQVDSHVYVDHIEGLKEQLTRTPGQLPRIRFLCEPKHVTEYTWDDIEIVNYKHDAYIPFNVAT